MNHRPDIEIGVALTIAGTDPSGAAGINVDLQVFRDLGFHGAAAITAVVWQNTQGVGGFKEVEPQELRAQLKAVEDDFEIRAVKIGMVPTGDLMVEVRKFLWRLDEDIPVVLDPVMAEGSGVRTLMAPTGRESLQSLSGRVDLVTPNADEARQMLFGTPGCETPTQMVDGLLKRGWKRVLLKGGHLRQDRAALVVDWYGDEKGVVELGGVDPVEWDVRGTGCQLSSAIAAERARGKTWLESVEGGRAYLNELVTSRALSLGKGRPIVVRVEEMG